MKNYFFNFIKIIHKHLLFSKRVNVIVSVITNNIPNSCTILDVGCGDGTVAKKIIDIHPNISIQGLEIQNRPTCKIPCAQFDGKKIPYKNSSFDYVLFVDVLHHTTNIKQLLHEASKVAKKGIIIKDHLNENPGDKVILKIMDWIGNRPHNVKLVYNYLGKYEWENIFKSEKLVVSKFINPITIYSFPIALAAPNRLQFITVLHK